MNLLTAEHLTKAYTERVLFDDAQFGIQEGDKIGIIGVNGTGKSTLLRILAGREEPDAGTVTKGNQVQIRFLEQKQEFEDDRTILETVMEGNQNAWNAWTLESDAKSMLNRLGLSDFSIKMGTLSGGQKKRAALARVLLGEADILILDEPTNHLDNEMAGWLEEYLIAFRGALVLVTHDRYFLDRVVNRIVEIDHGKLYGYPGSYSEFVRLKEARQNSEIATERKRQSILRTELEWLARGARARSTKQKAHIQRIEELQKKTGPVEEASVEMSSVSTRMGRTTLEVEHLSKSLGGRLLFQDFSYIFLKQDRIGIIGENGCGKSTLLNILTGRLQPDEGSVTVGETIKIGYFAQDGREMDGTMRAIDYVREAGEYVRTTEGLISAAMMMERFLFDGNLQYGFIDRLSGGERRRLQLLRVLMSAPNVLILDEPTNDLDIRTLTILEDYLDHFDGIVITVSHDRYFLDRIVRRIFAFEDGRLRQYEGGYSDYLASREQWDDAQTGTNPGRRSGSASKSAGAQKNSSGRENHSVTEAQAADAGTKRQGRTHREVLKFSYKEQREYDGIEEEIERLEGRLSELESEIDASASDYTRLTELTAQQEETQKLLEEKMERWEYLSELAEKIAAQS